jgi:hypothetical protein
MKSDDVTQARVLLKSPALSQTALPDGSSVILDIDRHQVLSASEVGTFVLDAIRDGADSLEEVTRRIVCEFDVDAERARQDAAAFIAELVQVLTASGPHA